MKLIIAGMAFAISVSSFAQHNKNIPLAVDDKKMDAYLKDRKPAELKITLINSKKNPIDVMVKYTVVHPGSETQETGHSSLDSNGKLSIVLKENLPYQQVWLSVGDYYYAGLCINSDLQVNIDAAKIKEEVFLKGEGVSLDGADAELNTILAQQVLFKSKEKSTLHNRLVDASINSANNQLPVEKFLVTADSIFTVLNAIDKEFLAGNPRFAWAIENETSSFFYGWFIVGFSNKEIPADWMMKINNHHPYFVSNDGIAFYRSLSTHLAYKRREQVKMLQQELYANQAILTPEQKAVIDSIKRYESSGEAGNSSVLTQLYARRGKLFRQELDRINLQQSLLSIQDHANGMRADILKMQLMERWKDQFAYVYPAIINSVETSWAKGFVQSKLDQAAANQRQLDELFRSASAIQQGNDHYIGRPLTELSFGARLYRLDSMAKMEDFIVNLRSRFANKALVLDIWATWCAPCIADIPFSVKLHEENKDLPIEYVYLCTTSGSDEDTWKRRIGSLKPPGNHIFIDESLLNDLRRILRAQGGFPTYVVIDKDGKVNAKAISFMNGLDRDKLKAAVGIN